MICQRCQQDKPKIEFNNWIRYQRPVREPYSEFCCSCVWEQASCQVNWQSCLERLLWRSQFFGIGRAGKREADLFHPVTIDDLIRPLVSWAYGEDISTPSPWDDDPTAKELPY